jgi:hypothetical protein
MPIPLLDDRIPDDTGIYRTRPFNRPNPQSAGAPRRSDPFDKGASEVVNKHTVTVIAAAIVISLGLLGWYALVGYVVTITGSADSLPNISAATERLISAVLGLGQT